MDSLKYIAIALVVAMLLGGAGYVMNLRSSLIISRENEKTLQLAIQEQKDVIETKTKEIQQIKDISQEIRTVTITQEKYINTLRNKFTLRKNGDQRDFGYLARSKPLIIEGIINKSTKDFNRCLEIETGAGGDKNECN